MVLPPLLDVLQSVPVLGYLSLTIVFFVSLFPSSILGPELAAIFAFLSTQARNMAFSFFPAPRTTRRDLDEASRSFRFSGQQRFWQLEVPFAMPDQNERSMRRRFWAQKINAHRFVPGGLQFKSPPPANGQTRPSGDDESWSGRA